MDEEVYRRIVDFLPFPAMIHQDMKVAYANDIAAKNFGSETKEELIGKPILSFMSKESLQIAKQRIELMLEKGTAVEPLIEKVLRKNGDVIEIEITAFPITYKGKPAIFLVAQDRTPIKRAYDEIKEKNIELGNIRKANLNIIEDLTLEIKEKKKIEEKLRASEEKFRTIFESSPDAVFIMKNEVFVDCNKAALKMFDCKKEDLIGKTPVDFSPEFQPDGKPSIKKAQSFIKNAYLGYPQFLEWRHLKLNGETFDAEVRLTRFKLGKEKYLSVIVRDISERKRMIENLEENEERFRTLASSTSTAIFVYQGERFIYGNKATLKLIGYSEKAFTQVRFWDVVHPDFKELIRRRGMARQRGEKVPNRYEFKIITKDGEERWIDFTAGKIIWKGKPAAIGTAFDITNRKIAEEYLKESEERFRSLAELLPVAVFETDLNIKIIYANRKAFELFKFTDRDLKKGIDGLKLIGENDRERAVKNVRVIYEKGLSGFAEYTAVKKDGTTFPTIFRTNTIVKNGKVIGLRGVVEDITQQKRSEAILRIQYEIAHAVSTAKNLEELFNIVQTELNQLIDSSNLYYAEYDKEHNKFVAPFERDEKDNIAEWVAEGSLSGYLVKKGKVLLLNKVKIEEMSKSGEIQEVGTLPEQWLGTPIKSKGKIIGVLAIQSYKNPKAYDKYSADILEIIANQISSYIEQKKIEMEALKLSRAVEESPSAIFITDTDWRIQYANPKLSEISGYSNEELIGRKTSIFKSGMHSDFYLEYMKEAVAKGSDWAGEFVNKKKNGELFWVRSSVSPLLNDKGHIVNYIIVQEDITEKKKMEEKLMESEAHFRSVWENSHDAMRLVNSKGEIVDVNNAFCELVGKSKNELLGKPYFVIYKNFQVEKGVEIFPKRFNDVEKQTKFESEVQLWNGKRYWLELSNSVLKFKDKSPLMLSIIRDISQRKEMIWATIEAKEKAEEMNRIKTQFFIYMSHELRTPFMGIMGYAQLLSDELKDPLLQSMTKGIINTSKRMLDTLNNILDVTKLEFDQNEMVYSDVNLGEAVLDVYNNFLVAAREKNIKLIKKIPKEEITFKTDRRIIYGILNNLVNNAVKFTDSGFVEIKLNRLNLKNNQAIRLTIKDTGVGIPIEKQKLIWEEFRQASEGTARAYQGSGLGLTIVKKYVEMLNGKITLKSEENKGSTFIVELPIDGNNV